MYHNLVFLNKVALLGTSVLRLMVRWELLTSRVIRQVVAVVTSSAAVSRFCWICSADATGRDS